MTPNSTEATRTAMMVLTPAIWLEAMKRVEDELGSELFQSWLTEIEAEDLTSEGELVLVAPNGFTARWVEKKFLEIIESAFTEELGSPVSVRIISDSRMEEATGKQPERSTNNGQRFAAGSTSAPDAQKSLRFQTSAGNSAADASTESKPLRSVNIATGRAGVAPLPKLNPRYTFEDFIVGESNRYAQAAAQSVADPNAKGFNPLVIYGGTGLGKTHLMHAIGHHLYKLDPTTRVLYVTSESFINSFIESIQSKTATEFRNSFRNVDLLLIDDLQFLTGKERTQQEFFHTFNALYDAGKKLVMTCDRPPRSLETLEDRLRSRFEWGLIVDVQLPDLETKAAILKKKAELENIKLPGDVVQFIAQSVAHNVRELEGALKRLDHASSLHGTPINLAMARDILGHMNIGMPAATITVEDVQRSVCEYFKVKVSELTGANRSKRLSKPRHIAQFLSRKLTSLSFPDIAQKFGGKDHTSIIYACKKIESEMLKDPNLQGVMEHLTKQITKGADQ